MLNADVHYHRKRKGGICLEDEADNAILEAEKAEDEESKKQLEEAIKDERETKKAEVEKKKSDDIWASFLSDIPAPPKRKPVASSGLGALSRVVKVTQLCTFIIYHSYHIRKHWNLA